ncbi:hypothetical protein JTE90_008572 [Oedothorax gibbosus]|uniref:Uncharacterized protein n=1 Tax=Oedothorax gibbosus TaxID=931172 RepID=A0AAV6TRY8_9ARAC|nr:hypothetical protein JTE90_008572 [Oedothorax gibbosus]
MSEEMSSDTYCRYVATGVLCSYENVSRDPPGTRSPSGRVGHPPQSRLSSENEASFIRYWPPQSTFLF